MVNGANVKDNGIQGIFLKSNDNVHMNYAGVMIKTN